MTELRFEWDDRKSKVNQEKNGVSFDEARSVFKDEHAIEFYDPDHSADEDRFILLGLSAKLRILVVCHCIREADLVIRLIAARKATQTEQMAYREANQ